MEAGSQGRSDGGGVGKEWRSRGESRESGRDAGMYSPQVRMKAGTCSGVGASFRDFEVSCGGKAAH